MHHDVDDFISFGAFCQLAFRTKLGLKCTPGSSPSIFLKIDVGKFYVDPFDMVMLIVIV